MANNINTPDPKDKATERTRLDTIAMKKGDVKPAGNKVVLTIKFKKLGIKLLSESFLELAELNQFLSKSPLQTLTIEGFLQTLLKAQKISAKDLPVLEKSWVENLRSDTPYDIREVQNTLEFYKKA
jgi:hypothetical protein